MASSLDSGGEITRFTQVDAAPDPTFFINFVDSANRLASVRECKRKMIELMCLAPGDRVLEVGCGTGDDAREAAQFVGEHGAVVGLDASETMIAEAQRRSAGAWPNVTFQLGDACALPFADGEFDVCRSERMLLHLNEPQRAVAEMTRVLKPGGRVVAFDFDFDAAVTAHPDLELTRRVVRAFSDAARCGTVGRRMPGMFCAAGLLDVTVTPHVNMPDLPLLKQILGGALERTCAQGLFSSDEIARWWDSVEETERRGEYFTAWLGFIVSGRKA